MDGTGLQTGFYAPHAEAAGLIASKPVVSRRVFDGLLPELQARAFTVTGIEDAHALQRIKDSIASLPMGANWEEVKADVVGQLDLWFDEDTAHRRAVLLLRTHGFQAFQAAQWNLSQQDEDTTHLQYLATEDSRVRASHLALNGVTLPKNDPFWRTHFPPWEWGCRCRVRLMNPDLVDLEREADVDRAPEDRNVIDGPALDQLRHGTLMRQGQRFDVTPPSERAADDQRNVFQWDPGSLRLSVDELRDNYDPEVWSAFEAWAGREEIEPGVSVWQWLEGVALMSVASRMAE